VIRLLLVLWVLLQPLPGRANEFDWMVREFSRETGAKQVHIPFLGLARFVVAVGHPAGTSDMRLAIFEKGDLECPHFGSLTDRAVGSSWKPMIRVREANGNATNIYVRPQGRNLQLLVTALERNEATFVQVRIQPEKLMRFVDEHQLHSKLHIRP